MGVRLAVWAMRSVTAIAVLLLAASPALGQAAASGNRPAVPRMPDGKPNLSGIWQVVNTAAWDIQDHRARRGVPAGQGVVEGNEIPYQLWALKKKAENFEKRATEDPEVKCLMPGVPRITYMPYPFQIFQRADYIAIVYEYVHAVRHVYINGTPHPEGPIEWWLGDSRARWEGDTLVIDVVHFTPTTWFDRAGNFHSEALHVVERYTMITPDLINYEATVEDPNVFTRPWKMSMPIYRRQEPNVQILEYECHTFEEDFPQGKF